MHFRAPPTKVPLFEKSDVEGWKAHLDDQGYAIITNVLDTKKHKYLLSQFYNDWCSVSHGFRWYDSATWTKKACPLDWNTGMFYWYGLGHTDCQWGLRTDEHILDIWKNVHGTDDLVVSYDGGSVYLSTTQQPSFWLHTDQNPASDLYSIQGAYNFLGVSDKGDAGWIVVPGSHETYAPHIDSRCHFIPVPEDNPIVDQAIQPILPQNSFILWNSRTIHANQGMEPRGSSDDDGEAVLNRITAYITYFPKAMRSEAVRRRRIEGYYKSENCGHYAFRHDVKRSMEEPRGKSQPALFHWYCSRLESDGNIPAERLDLI